mgnify:CR=1 FL=1
MDYLERIKGLREDRDITQSEIAKYLNVAQNTYSVSYTHLRAHET